RSCPTSAGATGSRTTSWTSPVGTGEEEFAVILPETGSDQASIAFEELVRAADHAKYSAKQAGKNRVAVAGTPSPALPA
ncbi:MAG TPA: hypothetical protein VFU42_08545, partial [Candidatus Deferrimicrobiaceae bacterium]|nr:hypothetical protein [Candidatus Deferrimicrobiaceae bacterium]